MYDIIVVGGGPAGLTAALYACRSGKRVLMIEKGGFGGQMTYSPKIENYPGFSSISGSELADCMVEQVLSQGAEVEVARVVALRGGDVKTVVTDTGAYTAKAVILATGAKHRLLGVPGEEKFIGDGISFCAVCDGAFYEGKTVAVVGGGNSALQEALLLCQTCKNVLVIQNLDGFTGEQRLIDRLLEQPNVQVYFSSTVMGFQGEKTLSSVCIADAHTGNVRELSVDGVFIAVGLVPENEAFSDFVRLENGYIQTDENGFSGVPGIFAAGDCRKKQVRQIATAIADGAAAALAACAYIEGR